MRFQSNQTLLLDADDTLWENNVLFERAIASFVACLDDVPHTAGEVREHLDAIERRTIAERGYGTESFRISLVRCFEELCREPPTDSQHRQIMGFVDSIVSSEIELLPGVQEAVQQLADRHRLILVTKGDDLEQREKLRRSGLQPCFAAVEVLAEKRPANYTHLVAQHALLPSSTWMIGNSPRSDINPALLAGLHAAFVPHAQTWVLEHEPLISPPEGQILLEVASLRELATLL